MIKSMAMMRRSAANANGLRRRVAARGGSARAVSPRAAVVRARESFVAFVQLLNPTWGEMPWFHVKLAQALEDWWISPESTALALFLPPGHAKSTYCKLFCAWLIGRDAALRIAYTSYAMPLAAGHLAEIAELMRSTAYQEVFPAARVRPEQARSRAEKSARANASQLDVIGQGGAILARGTRGSSTGLRIDLGVIDDPHKDADEARSAAHRERVWQWYTRVIGTRDRPGRPLKILLLQTRWHLDDLAGRALRIEPDQWRVLSWAAFKVGAPTEHDPREPGAALWPLLADEHKLSARRRRDPEGFAAQYQGDPIPPGGKLFKGDWLRTYEQLPDLTGAEFFQSWDLRNDGKVGKQSSWVAGLLLMRPKGTLDVYLVDVARGQWSTAETHQRLLAQQQQPFWSRARAKLIERKADGIGVLSLLGHVIAGMIPVTPTADKVTRARNVSPVVQAGNFYVPASGLYAPAWLADFLAELLSFPSGADDDQVDALSQALDYLFGVQDTSTQDDAAQQRAFNAMIGKR